MSVFIVDESTISVIVSWLSRGDTKYYVKALAGIDLSSSENLERFGRTMLDMNVYAYTLRYRDSPDEQDGIKEYKYQYLYARDEDVSTALRCWMYQCDAFEDDNDWYEPSSEEQEWLLIYKVLYKLNYGLMVEIIRSHGLVDMEYWV